jgi:hypothetical protein
LSYAAAACCINATKQTIKDLRSNEEWDKIWAEAVSIAEQHDIPVTNSQSNRPKRQQRLPQRYDDSVVDERICTVNLISEYRVNIYYSTIDTVLEEMNRRFTELNISLMSAMEALVPHSDKFLDVDTLLPFLEHYEIPEREIRVEAMTAIYFFAAEKNKP